MRTYEVCLGPSSMTWRVDQEVRWVVLCRGPQGTASTAQLASGYVKAELQASRR